jgi:peptide/nickel transport system ATP-binding protein
MTHVLEVQDLVTQFSTNEGALTVVDHVNFNVKQGETLGIVGESGCGKSVTSLSIMGLLDKNGKITKGKINLNGTNLLDLNSKELRKIRGKQMSMIFQEPMTSLNPVLTVGKQIGEVFDMHSTLSTSEKKKNVIELLTLAGIPRAEEIYSEYPHRLSGGMRQRVMIGMAIACKPQLLIADEPTTALDVTIQAQILDLIKKIRSEVGMSIIMITHDLGVIAEICDRVMVMYAGQVIESANVRTLLREPKHPYTVGLIQSTPQKSKGLERLFTISGNVPSPGEISQGCRFAPRCDKVMPICLEKDPELMDIDEQSSCRCWLYK